MAEIEQEQQLMNSNTTLVKVKSQTESAFTMYINYSNTTLVKVKCTR